MTVCSAGVVVTVGFLEQRHTHTHTQSVLPAVQGCAVPEDEEMEDSPPGAAATEEDDSIL